MTGAEPTADRWAVDTSVAIAFLDAFHSAQQVCVSVLAGEAARANGRVLLTRDRRASATCDFLGVEHRFVA